MNPRPIQCLAIAAILLLSTFANVLPGMAQLSPASDISGVWKGTASWTDSFDYYPSSVSCSFTSDVELDLTQDGTSFGGSIFYTNVRNTQVPHDPACDTVAHPPGPQIAYGQVSSSSFGGTIYDGVPIKGTFTTDLISGTIKGSNGAQKWDLAFKAERQGAPTPPQFPATTQSSTTAVQAPAAGSLKTDSTQYQLSSEHTTPVTITGNVKDGRGDRVTLAMTRPDGSSEESYAYLISTGNFESIYNLDKNSPVGQYQLTIKYNGMTVDSTSFAVSYPQSVTGTAIPESVKYLLYKNDNYGFSIEYPSDWAVANHFEEKTAVVGASFSPDKNLEVDVGVQKNNNPFAGMAGQQVLDSITTLLKNRCSSTTLQANGYTCTPGQYSQNTISYQGVPAYLVVGGWTKTFPDGTTTKWLSEWFVIPNGNDVWLLVIETSADDFKTYGEDLSHMGDSFSITGVSQPSVTPAAPYSNYFLQQGEWVKYKMHLEVTSNNATMQQIAQDQMSKSFSAIMGQQLNSIDDIDWMKYTITSVSPNDIMTHGEMQVLGRHVDLGDASLGRSPFAAIPTNAKVGDTFDSPLSTPGNPSKVTLTAVTQENILGQNVNVFELTSHQTVPGEGATTQADQVLHYDTKTGILLDWILGMKIYSSSLFVNMKFTMAPIGWSQAPAAPTYSIPGWVKNSAKWWAEGQLSDDEFVKGIQYLVQQGIVAVPASQPISQPSQGIPAWVKNTAKWWAEGQLSDSDFVKGVQYLVQAGIISTHSTDQGQGAVTDQNGVATFQINGQAVQFSFVDSTTGKPVAGADVVFALDPQTQSVGTLLVIDPANHYPMQVVIMTASPQGSTIQASWQGYVQQAYAESKGSLVVNVAKDPRTVGSLMIVTFLPGAGATAGSIVNTLYEGVALAAKYADKKGWLPVSSYLQNQGFATGTVSYAEAKDDIHEEAVKGVVREAIFLAGGSITGHVAKEAIGATVGTTINAAQTISDLSTVSGCNPDTQEIKYVQIGFTRIYSCAPNKAFGLLRYDPPQETADHVSLELLSKANKGFGERVQVTQGQPVPAPAGDYSVTITAPGKTPQTEDVTITPSQTATLKKLLHPVPSTTPALGISLAGDWQGTTRGNVRCTVPEPDPSDEVNCSYSATIHLHLTQAGNSVRGTIQVTNLSLSGQNCDQVYGSFGGQLAATIFGSGFSGTASGAGGSLQVNGQFTQDLMKGTYGGTAGDLTISGDFTASRVG